MLSKIKTSINDKFKTMQSLAKSKLKQLDKHPVFQLILYAIVLVLVLEMLNRRSIIKGFGLIISNPLMFLFNVLIILLTLSITMMFRKKSFFLILITVIWLGVGVANFILLFFRTTPLTAMDFYMINSVIGMIHIYLTTFQIILIFVIVIILVLAMILIWRKSKKIKALIKIPLIMIGVTAVLMLLVSNVSLKVKALSTNYGNLAEAYTDYGFAYCFSISIFDRGIDKPDVYSEENIDTVLKKIEYEATKNDPNNENLNEVDSNVTDEFNESGTNSFATDNYSKLKPNIIFVQLESFFDVNDLLDYSFSENPVPNFTKLKEDYSSGYVTVPSIGAGTANTEFEIITGMNIEYFGAGEYPYKTILQSSTCESICYNLAELGYSSHAIHNNTGTFYDRNIVFQKLGFDSFSSIEYMNDVEYNPIGWPKDNVLTTEILKALNAKDTKDFIYTISVQAHGKYPVTRVDENQKITVLPDSTKRLLFEASLEDGIEDSDKSGNAQKETDEDDAVITSAVDIDIDKNYKNQFEYFVNQLSETDKFVGELIDELSDYNEPTIVVFFGDHLPPISLENGDLVNDNKFQTEYVIWDNFDMQQVDRDLKAYQLNAYVMERIGYDNGILTKFHRRYISELDYLDELEVLQYDMLYGNKNVYEGENPFIEKTLQMGALEIRIHDVIEKGEALFIQGDNFTPWSVVYIDHEAKETLYIDENTLIVPYEEVTDDGIYVAQVAENKAVLSQSKEWISDK